MAGGEMTSDVLRMAGETESEVGDPAAAVALATVEPLLYSDRGSLQWHFYNRIS